MKLFATLLATTCILASHQIEPAAARSYWWLQYTTPSGEQNAYFFNHQECLDTLALANLAGFPVSKECEASATKAATKQRTFSYTTVDQLGQVRLDFTVHFSDGSSLSFQRPNSIHVVSRVYDGDLQVGWICRAHEKNFFTAVGNVQL